MKPAVIFKTGLKLILYLRSNGYTTTWELVSMLLTQTLDSSRVPTIKEWDEDDQSNGIEVLQKVVWGAVQRHRSSLRDQIVPDLNPADEVQREEKEEL